MLKSALITKSRSKIKTGSDDWITYNKTSRHLGEYEEFDKFKLNDVAKKLTAERLNNTQLYRWENGINVNVLRHRNLFCFPDGKLWFTSMPSPTVISFLLLESSFSLFPIYLFLFLFLLYHVFHIHYHTDKFHFMRNDMWHLWLTSTRVGREFQKLWN